MEQQKTPTREAWGKGLKQGSIFAVVLLPVVILLAPPLGITAFTVAIYAGIGLWCFGSALLLFSHAFGAVMNPRIIFFWGVVSTPACVLIVYEAPTAALAAFWYF